MNLALLVICSLHDIMWLTLLPLSTLNMHLESMSITIKLKGGKLKRGTVLELYFVSSRNTCHPRLLDVLLACKHAHFTCESGTSSSVSKFYDLECSTPPYLEQFPL